MQIAVDGKLYNYYKVGNESKEAYLILHGWGRSGNEWMQLASDIAKDHKVIVYVLDLPGFGGSSLPEVNNIEEYTKLVVKFCQYLRIDKLTVVGHSLGGRVATVMATKNDIKIKKLVLIDSAGLKVRNIRMLTLSTATYLFRWVPKSIKRVIASKFMDEDYSSNPRLRDLYRAVVKNDLLPYLKLIKIPTLVIWGERDLVLPVSLTHIYKWFVKDSKIRIVWGAGHDPHITHYAQLFSILEEELFNE